MEIDLELDQHHRATLRAIETGRVDVAKRRLEAYVEFAQAFLEAASKKGIRFSDESSRAASVLEWPTVALIVRYAWDGISAAVGSGSRELMLTGAYLPAKFLVMSVEQKDFLFFRRMSAAYPHLLSLSYGREPGDTRRLLVDRSWRYLKEFAHYYLIRHTADMETSTRNQYVLQVLWTFSDLMKVAMDHDDSDTFGLIGRELNRVFDNADIIGVPNPEVADFQQLVGREFDLIWFGFGAWLARSQMLRDAPQQPGHPNPKIVRVSSIVDFLQVIGPNFKDIRALSETYFDALGKQYRGSRWEDWLMDTLIEGEVHTLDFGRWLTYFYAIEGLRLSETGSASISNLPVLHRDLQFRISEIRAAVQEVLRDRDRWLPFFRPIAPSAQAEETDAIRTDQADRFEQVAEDFLNANQIAIEEWKRLRGTEIIDSALSDSKLLEFKTKCLEAWRKQAWIIRLLAEHRLIDNRPAEPGASYLALHHTYPREAFIEKPDAVFVDFGENEGRKLGSDLSKAILEQFRLVSTIASPEPHDTIVDRIISEISDFKEPNTDVIVVGSGGYDLEREFTDDTRFVPHWREGKRDVGEYLGRLGNAPTYFQYRNDRQDEILLLAIGRIGKLLHYVPNDDNFNGLMIRITPIDRAQAEELVDGRPTRSPEEEDNLPPRETQIQEMMERVIIFVGAKFELESNGVDGARTIPISN